MSIDIMGLSKMTEVELNAMKKSELVAAIQNNNYQPHYYRSQKESLEKTIADNQTNERAACVMLAAFVGIDLLKSDYSDRIDTSGLNILELAGLVAAKCVAVSEKRNTEG